jgi:transglutaminase-like putative cysteine protease
VIKFNARLSLLSTCCLALALQTGYTEEATKTADDAPDLASRIGLIDASYVINKDGSFTETRKWEMTVLKERALESAKNYTLTYSTSIQKADVLEAYTRKANGKKVKAPKSNYQVEANSGKGKDAPIYSDRTSLTVVFPDVAVGDTVVFSYKLTAKEPMFAGHFSETETYSKVRAFDNIHIRIDAPSSLWTQYRVKDMQEVRNEEKSGHKILELAWKNPNPVKSKRRNYSVYDRDQEAGFSFSTFHNYEELANAYAKVANPKVLVNERVQKQADEIVGDRKDPHDVAKALYDWVAVNIDYAGNCVGLGAVVPHDVSFILDNRIGDCKDHATLLQALLQAKGIASTQALINAGSSYKLPAVPVVSMVNHVINYIPSMDMFTDSTSASTPFGMLPFSDQDKPVLLVNGYREGTKTPPTKIGTNEQKMKTVVNIHADGSAQVEMFVTLKGSAAVSARSRFRDVSTDYEKDFVKNVLESSELKGSGVFTKADPKPLLNTYDYSVKFDVKNLLPLPGTSGFYVYPLFYSEAPIMNHLGAAFAELEELQESTCSNGYTEEDYTYNFPKGMKILSTPDAMKQSNGRISYTASYELKGNTLTVKRIYDDKTPGNVCPVSIGMEDKAFAEKIMPNFKSQVIYKM